MIVIDGGSTDGAVDVIRSHEHLLSYWVSEPDASVSAAVNKGLKRARGTIVKLVGDDDLFWEGAFRKGVEYLDQHPDVDCVVFHSNWMLEFGDGRTHAVRYAATLRGDHAEVVFGVSIFGHGYAGGGVLCTGSLRDVNGYNEQLHIWAYWDLGSGRQRRNSGSSVCRKKSSTEFRPRLATGAA